MGNRNRAQSLGYATITNDGTGTDDARNYDVAIFPRGSRLNDGKQPFRRGRVEQHNPKTRAAWWTVVKCLVSAFWPSSVKPGPEYETPNLPGF